MAVSMYSVTSQQDPSPGTSGADYLKRPLHHHVDLLPGVESDFEPAVKMKCSSGAGGGGRRKQSKPIRVRSDADVTPAVEDLMVDIKMPVTASPSARDCSSSSADARQLATVEAVTFDVDEHSKLKDSVAGFPTKYHQLGSELKQEVGLGSYERENGDAMDGEGVKSAAGKTDAAGERRTDMDDLKRSPQLYFDRQNTDFNVDVKPLNQFSDNFYKTSHSDQFQDKSPTSKAVDCLPTNLSIRSTKLDSPGNSEMYSAQPPVRSLLSDMDMLRTEMQDAERLWADSSDGAIGVEKSRIFHPDAYCNICDREFCNKYFLKTHRANKHGIYDGPSSDPTSGNSNSGTLPALSGMVFSQPGLAANEGPSVPLVEADRATPKSLNCTSTATLTGVLPIPQLPSSFGVLPFDDTPLPPQQQAGRSSDMEDYCDICQKHFCNKYYLRKHRQDVHGLSLGDVSSSRRAMQADSVAADIPHFPLRVSSSTASSSLPAPPPPSALSNFPMFLPPPFGAPLPVVSPFMPGAAGLPFGPLQFGGVDAAASAKLSTSSTSSSTSQQQQLTGTSSSLLPGMLSADAYLDLFRKELLGGYLMSNGDHRDMTAAFAAVAAAAAIADPAAAGALAPTRLPPIPPGAADHHPSSALVKLEPGANPTPDTFAEMLQRIGARIGKKNDGVALGGMHHDLFRLNGLQGLSARLPAASLPSTTASSSSSSRLVDRVVCDLCNKEVCNKYFLKTHKMKVHGWDPNTSTMLTMSSASNTPSFAAESGLNKSVSSTLLQPPLMFHAPSDGYVDKPPLPFLPTESSRLQTAKDVELQQMGIDPEAYCEICRKEFCSKYFLRTHRQNIHGIMHCDTSRSSSPGATAAAHQGMQTAACSAPPPLFSSTGPFSSLVLAPPPLPVCLPSTVPAMSIPSTCVSSSMFLFGTAAGGGLASNESSSGSSDGHLVDQRWKWKEPVNATRVSCTLCNKVLCNKYFLRTHMAKRHGVTVDTRLLPPQAPLLPPTAGVALQVRDLTQPATNGVTHQMAADGGTHAVDRDNNMVDGTCLDAAGKTGAAVNLVLTGPGRSSNDIQTVTARTWHVPADDTAATTHHSDVTSAENSSALPVKQVADERVKCALCAAAMSDREALLQHLTSVHYVDDQMSASLVAAATQSAGPVDACSPGSSSSEGLAMPGHMHPSQLPPRTPTSGGTVRRRRQFRCAFCRERFRTRVHCELHARAAHPRATGSCVEVTPAVETVDVAASSPPRGSTSLPAAAPVYGRPLDADDAARAQLLPFILRESVNEGCERLFSTSLVYLPTFRRLTSPTTFSFTLTPVLQPSP